MSPTIRVITTIAIVLGAIVGTALLDVAPFGSSLCYLGSVSLWFALNKDNEPKE